VQLKAGRAGQLGVETPVEVGQADLLVQTRAFVAALHQARAPTVEFVLQHGGKRLQEGLLGSLCLHQPGGQCLGHA